ncbi:MAG: helix-turn-helix domain-containing protein [Myxococcota bacterium]
MNARTFAVPRDLADIAAALWTGEWDLRGQPPHDTELLSDPCVHLVLEDGDRWEARLVGVWTELWRRRLEGRGRVRGIKLRAGAVQAIVDRSAHTLRNRIVPLDELFDRVPDLRHLDDSAAFVAFAAWLRELRRPDATGGSSLAVALVARLADDPSITSVARFAEVAGVGPRELQRIFRLHVGASPKWVLRRFRLQEVAFRIERGQAPSLAQLAVELGYTDQAHLARDFKAAVGQTPRAFGATVRE